jgi:hypothetical protein
MKKTYIHVHLNTPKPIGDKITYFYRVIAALTNNPHVTISPQALADAKAHVDKASASNINVKTVGARQRDADLDVAAKDMELFRRAVEDACNANPALADAIVQSAEMAIEAHPGPHPKDEIHASSNGTPDEILVRMKASDKPHAAYEIAYTLDQSKDYTSIGVSTVAHNVIKGLPLGAVVWIRGRIIIGNVPGPWTNPIRFVVH